MNFKKKEVEKIINPALWWCKYNMNLWSQNLPNQPIPEQSQILFNKKSQPKNFLINILDLQGSNRLQTLDQLLGLFLDCKSIKSSGWLQPKLDKNLVNSKRVWLPCILYNAKLCKLLKEDFFFFILLFF